jgi:hypothetical protein
MHPDIEALVQKLREAEKVLRAYHESRWADWLASDADRIHRLDFYGVEHLLSAFGGMGSLNDVVLQHRDGAVWQCLLRKTNALMQCEEKFTYWPVN